MQQRRFGRINNGNIHIGDIIEYTWSCK